MSVGKRENVTDCYLVKCTDSEINDSNIEHTNNVMTLCDVTLRLQYVVLTSAIVIPQG